MDIIALIPDKIRDTALVKMERKYNQGAKEHGNCGMKDANLNMLEWLRELQNEMMDAVFYIEVILQDEDIECGEGTNDK